MSLRSRLSLAATCCVAVIVIGFGIGIALAFSAGLHGQLDAHLDQVGGVVSAQVARGTLPDSAGIAVVAHTSGGDTGNTVARRAGVAVTGAEWATPGGHLDITTGVTPYRVTVIPVSATLDGSTVTAVAVGVSEQAENDATSTLDALLLAGAVVAVLLAFAGAQLAARTAVAPLLQLTETIETVAANGDLTRRVTEPPDRTEMGRLARAYNQAQARIEAMYVALEAVVVKQRRFVADASHELRTPLTTIGSTLQMLDRFPHMPEDRRQGVVTDALHESERMGRLIEDLLELARMDAGERLERVPFDWASLLDTALGGAAEQLAPRRVSLSVAADLGGGVGDPGALTRAIQIVLENVRRHTPHSTSVAITAARSGADVAVTVADDGPGVPEAMLEHIFERFVQVDAARQGEATGLGLAIAKAILSAHGGSLSAIAASPHGLVVRAVVPPMQPSVDRRRAPRPPRPDRVSESPASPA